MRGLDISRAFFKRYGLPMLCERFPEYEPHIAAGLVGEGSECWGFDDEISRDHDWGPGFCVWLTEEDYARFGGTLAELYAALPAEYLGFRRLRALPQTSDRVGVMTVGGFYTRYLGRADRPPTVQEWRYVPESGLAVVTNGRVFQDPAGAFTAVRSDLLAYFPEELRRKKLAMHCALAGQSGQYNYARCLAHGEPVAALLALGEFLQHVHAAAFLLCRRYRPYYKWADRALRELPGLGAALPPLLRRCAEEPERRAAAIEEISAVLIAELRQQGLTNGGSDFLLHHGEELQAGLTDGLLRRIPLMAE